MVLDNVIRELEAIVGPEHLLTAAEDRWPYAFDATDLDHLPDMVIFSGSAAQGAQTLVKAAKSLYITVHDHLIVSKQGYFSLAEHNMI